MDSRYICRSRLITALDGGSTTTRLTVVTSPAGAGKTTLLAGWAAAAEDGIAWLDVDVTDRDPARFWMGVTVALAAIAPGCGDRAQIEVRKPGGVERALNLLLDDLESASIEYGVLVLDNLHLADDDPVIAATLSEFAQSLPRWLHLVLASRHAPAIPLPRMRVRGEVTELDFDDLRFSPAEATQLLSRLAPDLSGEQISTMAQRADGWAASLVLDGLAARETQVPARTSETRYGDQRLLHEYFLEEILAGEDEDVVTALMDVAVVERVGGRLADTLTDRCDALQLLLRAEQRGLFITRYGAEGWFELHSVARSAFLRELSRAPTRMTELHRRAARWFTETGETVAAFEHLMAAGDQRDALRLLAAHHAELFDVWGEERVRAMIAQIPIDVSSADDEALLDYAWCHLLVGQPTFIELARRLTRRSAGKVLNPQVRAQMDILGSVAACITGNWAQSGELVHSAHAQMGDVPARSSLGHLSWTIDARQLALAEQWDDLSDEIRQIELSLTRDPNRRLEFEGIRALGVALTGQPVDALRLAAGVRRAADVTHRSVLQSELAITEAIAYRELGDTDRAISALHDCATRAAGGFSYCRLLAVVELAGAALDAGDLSAAQAQIDEAVTLAGRHGGPGHWDWIARAATRLALRNGDHRAARQWAARTSDSFWQPVSAARVELALGETAAALDALEAAQPRCIRHDVVLALLRAQAMRSREEALKQVASAVDLASANGLLQTVASEGPDVVQLAERVAWRVPETWVDRLRRAPSGASIPSRQSEDRLGDLRNVLTERERDVLRFLPSRLTLREIADELRVSVNTLKFHLKVIYRKLDVASRSDAATIARRLAKPSG